MMNLFEIKNLNYQKKSLDGKRVTDLFQNFSLTIPSEQSVFTIMGPSGCGKSTLLRMLNRLEDPDKGEILYKNKSICDDEVRVLRKKIGMVFQLPTLPEEKLVDSLFFGPQLWGKEPLSSDVYQYMESLGLKQELLQTQAKDLSVGQQQRFSLIRALLNDPEILLLDEPTASLDRESTEQMETFLIQKADEGSFKILWVTHQEEQAQRLGGVHFHFNHQENQGGL